MASSYTVGRPQQSRTCDGGRARYDDADTQLRLHCAPDRDVLRTLGSERSSIPVSDTAL